MKSVNVCIDDTKMDMSQYDPDVIGIGEPLTDSVAQVERLKRLVMHGLNSGPGIVMDWHEHLKMLNERYMQRNSKKSTE